MTQIEQKCLAGGDFRAAATFRGRQARLAWSCVLSALLPLLAAQQAQAQAGCDWTFRVTRYDPGDTLLLIGTEFDDEIVVWEDKVLMPDPGGGEPSEQEVVCAAIANDQGAEDGPCCFLKSGDAGDISWVVIVADAGDDVIDTTGCGEELSAIALGGPGNDTMYLGAGNDGDLPGDEPVDGGPGNDLIYSGAGDDYVSGGDESPEECLLAPKNRPISLPGVEDVFCDVIYGGIGDDILKGGAGNDFISGGPHLLAGEGSDDDSIDGESGSDYLYGGDGDDLITGGADNDIITGGRGNDTLAGGSGLFDVLDYLREPGDIGNVNVNYGARTARDVNGNTDSIVGFEAIRGTNDHDTIIGSARGATTIMGMAGNDYLMGGINADLIFGGSGIDTIYTCGSEDPDTEESESASCFGADPLPVAGSYVFGGQGNDTIHGAWGADVLFGDGDELIGLGPDAPTTFDTNGNVVTDFELGEPHPADPTIPRNIEVLDLYDLAIGPLGLLRDQTPGIPYGNADEAITQLVLPPNRAFARGNDEIHGGNGADLIVGGPGNDVLEGDGLQSNNGTPEHTIGADVIWGDLHIVLGKPPFFPATLVSGIDRIAGGPGADVIYGCGGDDTGITGTIYGDLMGQEMEPGVGTGWNDIIFGDYDYDYLDRNGNVLGREEDDGIWEIDPTAPATLAIYSDTIYGGEGDDLIFGGAGGDRLVGGPGDDVIQGNSGVDVIFGGNDITPDYKDFSPRDTVDYSTASQWLHQGVMVMLGGNTEQTARTFEPGMAVDDGDPYAYGFGTGYDYIYGIENVIGSDFDDVIIGSSETLADLIAIEASGAGYVGYYMQNYVEVPKDGYAGVPPYYYYGDFANILLGRGGNDIIMGRGGEDLIVGGLGNDIICGDSDMHCDPDGDDPDVAAIVALKPYYPGFGLDLKPEHAMAGGNDYLFGRWGNDKLYGDGGDDLIRGGPGADLLSGGLGVDVLDYSDFHPSISAGAPMAITPVVVNLRKDPVNLETFEQELVDDLSVLPALPTALAPLPLAPCSNLNTVACPDTAIDGGDPGRGSAIPPIPFTPRSVDTIINSPPDDLMTPYFNESLDRIEIVLGTSGDDVIFGHQTKPNILVGWSGNDVLISGNSVYDPSQPDDNRLSNGFNPILYDNVVFGDSPGNSDSVSLLTIRFLPMDLGTAVEPGDDLIESGKGDNFLNGGDQTYLGKGDFIAYSHTDGPVTISLADSQPQVVSAAGSDTLLNFENLIGSRWVGTTGQGDILVGNEAHNQIFGLDGDDILAGGPGNDTLVGGLGEDTASYECDIYDIPCVDPAEFTVSQDPDTLVYFVSNDGQQGTDTLPGIERVLGPAGPIDLTAGTGGGGGGGTVPAPQLQIVLGVLGELKVSEPGGQVEIQFSASGGVGPYTAKWDPMTDIDPENASRKVTILTYAGGSFLANQIQTAMASPVRDTSYRLTVTDSKGSVKVAFVKVEVAAAFSAFAGADRIISLGQQVTLRPTVNGGVAPYTYSWEVQGTGDGGFLSAKNIPAITVAPTETTTYVLTVTDSLGSTATDSVVVTVFGTDGIPATPDDTGNTVDPGGTGTDTNPGGNGGDSTDDGDGQNSDGAEDSGSGSPARFALPICGAGANLTLVMAGLFMLAVMKRREW